MGEKQSEGREENWECLQSLILDMRRSGTSARGKRILVTDEYYTDPSKSECVNMCGCMIISYIDFGKIFSDTHSSMWYASKQQSTLFHCPKKII
jgi:hypothetical protein